MIRQATQCGPENGWGVRNACPNSESRLEVSLERQLVMANTVLQSVSSSHVMPRIVIDEAFVGMHFDLLESRTEVG